MAVVELPKRLTSQPETAPDAMAIPVFVTDVTWPCALVTKTGTDDAEPYVPAVPVLAMLNVLRNQI